jgi:glutathione peroxidase
MTIRQKLLFYVYPWLIKASKWLGKNRIVRAPGSMPSMVSFYSLSAAAINGESLSFSGLTGKKIVIVNTASDCGYTRQLEELTALKQLAGDRLEILCFPSNEFKQQEKANNEAIQQFCSTHYGGGYRLMQKSAVLPGPNQHPLYQWLTQATQNGWCNQAPEWNFSKYFIDEQGNLQAYAGPNTSPMDAAWRKLIGV